MAWTDDSPRPIGHHQVIAVLETVRARSITDPLFALFELFQKAEIPGNLKLCVCYAQSQS